MTVSTLYKLVACYGRMVAKSILYGFYRLQFRLGIIGIHESLIFCLKGVIQEIFTIKGV